MCQLFFCITLTQQFVPSLVHLQGCIIKFLSVIFKLMVVVFYLHFIHYLLYLLDFCYQIVISGKSVHNVHPGSLDLVPNNSDKPNTVSCGFLLVYAQVKLVFS